MTTLAESQDLLVEWTARIVRARYKQTVLGGLWAVIQPAATVAIFSIVFTRFIPVDTGGVPYVLFSFVALVPWTLFSTSVLDMVSCLVDNMGLVTKIYFPREVLPVAATLARLLDFAIATSLVLILLVLMRGGIPLWGWLWVPAILVIQVALALGIGLFGSALNVFYRDVKHVFVLGLQVWMYASPIIYSPSVVPEPFRAVYFLNPMAGIIEAYRNVLLYDLLPSPYLLWSAFAAGIAIAAGYWFFKRVEFEFADVV